VVVNGDERRGGGDSIPIEDSFLFCIQIRRDFDFRGCRSGTGNFMLSSTGGVRSVNLNY
jgi:hypothetical protein